MWDEAEVGNIPYEAFENNRIYFSVVNFLEKLEFLGHFILDSFKVFIEGELRV